MNNLVIPVIITLALVISPFTSSASAFAAEKSIAPESTDISQVNQQQGITDELKAKVDPYVSIKDGKFVVDKTVFNVLTKDEKIEVENLAAESNRLISTEKGIFQIGNHFVQTASQSFCWKTFKDFLIKHGFTVTGKWMGPISLCGIVIF